MVLGNPAQAIAFIIDNNPEQVEANLNARGLLNNPDPTRQDLLNAVYGINDESEFVEVLSVPYIANQTNYTANLEEPLSNAIEKSGNGGGGFLNFAGGLLSIGTGVFTWLNTQEQQEIIESQIEAQKELDEKNRVLGIPIQYAVILVAIVAIVVVVAIIANRKK